MPPCEQENTAELTMGLFCWQIFIVHTDSFHTSVLCTGVHNTSGFLPSLTIPIVPVPLLSDFFLLLLFPLYSYTSLGIRGEGRKIHIHFPKRLPFHSHVLGTCLILGISKRSKTNKSNKACAVCLSESDFGNHLLKG